jgi:hypothetical protein
VTVSGLLSRRRGDLIAIAVMAGMTCLVFWPAFSAPSEMLREDVAHWYQPYYGFAHAEVRAGRMPLWNPYTKLGIPFHASLHPSLFYPLRWPMFFMDFVPGFILMMMVHYFLTAVAGYALIRGAMGCRPPAALIGALGIAFGGFAIGHMSHANFFLSYPWFLSCILFVWLAVHRRQWLWALAAAGCVGLMGLIGSVHLLLLLIIALATFVVYFTIVGLVRWRRDRPSGWGQAVWPLGAAAGALVLGGVISAAQMLPAEALSKRSVRQKVSWEFINRACAHPGRNTLQMIVPFHYGNCRLGYWGEYMWHGSTHYTGILVLLGAVMSLACLKRERRLWFWIAMAGVGAVIGAGKYLPVYKILYNSIGIFGRMRNPTRIFWLAEIALCVMGALGLDRMLQGVTDKRELSRARILTSGAGGVMIVVLFISLMFLSVYAADPGGLEHWLRTETSFGYGLNVLGARTMPSKVINDFDLPSWGSAAMLVLSVGVVTVLVIRGKAVGPVMTAVLVAVLVADLFAFSFGAIMYQRRWRIIDGTPPRAKWLQENLGHHRYALWPPPPSSSLTNQVGLARGMQFRIRDAQGKAEGILDSIPRLRFVELVSGRSGRVYPAIVSASGTKYMLARKDVLAKYPQAMQIWQTPQYRKVREDDEYIIYENRNALPMAYFVRRLTSAGDSEQALRTLATTRMDIRNTAIVIGSPPATTASSAAANPRVLGVHTVPGRWDIEAETDAPAQLVLLEAHEAGWRAAVDGADARIYQTNDQFMSVEVPAGKHNVTFRYAPPEFRHGVILTIVGLVLAAGLGIAGYVLHRRRRAAAE